MLVAISFVTAASMQTTKTNEKKVSPLFRLRTKQAIGEKDEGAKTKINFINGRVFWFPKILQRLSCPSNSVPTWWSDGIACISCLPAKCSMDGASDTNINNQQSNPPLTTFCFTITYICPK